jgi:Fe2+ or Zn2+ uptake regulation protein
MTVRTDIVTLDRELTALLHARGLRVTPQRLVINRLLRSRDVHVTAEQLHAATTRDLPGTSLPTVYATLDLLVELGLVRRLRAGSTAVLYDSRTTDHHHAVCRLCGAVHDLDLPLSDGTPPHVDGFTVERVDVTVEGVCAACRRA